MKRFLKNCLVAVAGIMLFTACSQKTQEKALVFDPELTVAGKTTTISYNDKLTILSGGEDIKAVVYFWQDYHWIAQDLPLKHKSGLWKGKFNVPANAALVTLKFVSGDKTDVGGTEVYAAFTVDAEGKNIPSAYIGWGLLRAKSFEQYSIPGYVPDSVKIDNEVLRYWCNQELKNCPDERKHVAYYGDKALGETDKPTRFEIIENDVKYLLTLDSLGQITESDLFHALENVQNILWNDSLAAIIQKRIIEKYPDGILSRDNEIWRIFRLGTPGEREQAMEKFTQRFPLSKFQDTPTENAFMYLGKNFQSTVYNQIIKNNNYTLLEKYLHEIPYDYLTVFFWHIVQIPYSRGDATAEKLRPYADLLINEAMNRPRSIDQMVYSPSEWNNLFYDTRKDALLVYAKIMDQTGDTDKAFGLLQKIEPYYNGKSAEFSDFYISMLEKTGHPAQVISIVKTGVKENAASPRMIEILKQDYIKTNGSADGFDQYFNGLKLKDEQTKLQQRIKNTLINEPIQLFELEKLSGGTVDMAKLNGKIIVLDLWATWCAPCKAAMPGMQMVVNKYKNDENVAFFFVSTMEYSPDYKKEIEKFIKEKDYDFTVLIDAKNPETQKHDYMYSTYAKTFHFSGIPQKMIIDGNGRLRWRATGYEGSPSALADEIGYIIEFLKNNE